MLESLRDALVTVQNEVTNSIQKLRSKTSPTLQRSSFEAISSLMKTQAGSNLLLKYQLSIETIEQMNDEIIRLANLCSTRMGRVQQMCNERAETVLSCYSHLRSLKETTKEMDNLMLKIDKLNQFCSQTEKAITYLEALRVIANTEADIALMKSDLKKERMKVNDILKLENNSPDATHSLLALSQDEQRLQYQFDVGKERLEEVALEEFLSVHENES